MIDLQKKYPSIIKCGLECREGWTWLLESLTKLNCDYTSPSGTVTRVASSSFGTLSSRVGMLVPSLAPHHVRHFLAIFPG